MHNLNKSVLQYRSFLNYFNNDSIKIQLKHEVESEIVNSDDG